MTFIYEVTFNFIIVLIHVKADQQNHTCPSETPEGRCASEPVCSQHALSAAGYMITTKSVHRIYRTCFRAELCQCDKCFISVDF